MEEIASCKGKEVPILEALTIVREVVARARRSEISWWWLFRERERWEMR